MLHNAFEKGIWLHAASDVTVQPADECFWPCASCPTGVDKMAFPGYPWLSAVTSTPLFLVPPPWPNALTPPCGVLIDSAHPRLASSSTVRQNRRNRRLSSLLQATHHASPLSSRSAEVWFRTVNLILHHVSHHGYMHIGAGPADANMLFELRTTYPCPTW
jgi:hypothetical protein